MQMPLAKNKAINYAMVILFNIFLILISLWIMILPLAKNKSFYMMEFQKNNTVQITGYTEEELDTIAQTIIDFLYGKSDTMQVKINNQDVFSIQALKHMEDVKDLFVLGKTAGWVVLCLFVLLGLYLFFNFKSLQRLIVRGSLFTLLGIGLIVIAIGIATLVDFDAMFVIFHRIIFPDPAKFNDAFFGYQSNYVEAPGIDNLMLIKILSIEFFTDFFLIVIAFVILVIAAWILIITGINRKAKLLS
ncbi:MAG: DUF1461 domain-containing protein [Bacilli bacterium]|jgi:hypothetical protein|nr:DUF1461 domain-containing protein [Bacilli bacterium]